MQRKIAISLFLNSLANVSHEVAKGHNLSGFQSIESNENSFIRQLQDAADPPADINLDNVSPEDLDKYIVADGPVDVKGPDDISKPRGPTKPSPLEKDYDGEDKVKLEEFDDTKIEYEKSDPDKNVTTDFNKDKDAEFEKSQQKIDPERMDWEKPQTDPIDKMEDPQDFKKDPSEYEGNPNDYKKDANDYKKDPYDYQNDTIDYKKEDPYGSYETDSQKKNGSSSSDNFTHDYKEYRYDHEKKPNDYWKETNGSYGGDPKNKFDTSKGDNYAKWEDNYASYGDNGTTVNMDMEGMKVKASQDDENTAVKMDFDAMEAEGKMEGDSTTLKMQGDGYQVSGTYGLEHEGTMVSTEMKFDQYFMYSMDNLNGKGNSAPACGPSTKGKDPCKQIAGSENTCCTHVIMTDMDSGVQQSFYRCMNEKVLDVSFAVEIDGMSMAMGCSGGYSSAKYLTGSLLVSAATLAAMTFA